jgi:fumarylacetoacetate (FAA) hydrolase family protein
MQITSSHLPVDFAEGHFCARIMRPEGPCVIGFARGAAFDLTPAFGTASRFLEEDDAPAAMTRHGEPITLDLAASLANSAWDARDPAKPFLLSPIDLQTVKAAGVTYVRSMLERVVEERCRGDAGQAEAVRAEFRNIIGDDLAAIVHQTGERQGLAAGSGAKVDHLHARVRRGELGGELRALVLHLDPAFLESGFRLDGGLARLLPQADA